MKKAAFIIVLVLVIVFGGCSNLKQSGPDVASLAPLETMPPVLLAPVADSESNGRENVKMSGNLQNGTSYVFHDDGTLEFFNGDVEEIIKDNDYFRGRIAEIKEIRIADGVKKIGERVFSDLTAVSRVIFSESCDSIADYAFSGCTGIKSLVLNNGLRSIGAYCFRGCSSISDVTIGTGLQIAGENIFYGCSSLVDLRISSDVPSSFISDSSTLQSIEMTGTLQKVGNRAFYNCSALKTVHFGTTAEIGERAFFNCTALRVVDLPGTVSSVGAYAFSKCTTLDTLLTASEGKLRLGECAFSDCTAIQYIGLKEGVQSIGDRCFANCTALTKMIVPKSLTSVGTKILECERGASKLVFFGFTGTQREWGAIEGNREALNGVPDRFRRYSVNYDD